MAPVTYTRNDPAAASVAELLVRYQKARDLLERRAYLWREDYLAGKDVEASYEQFPLESHLASKAWDAYAKEFDPSWRSPIWADHDEHELLQARVVRIQSRGVKNFRESMEDDQKQAREERLQRLAAKLVEGKEYEKVGLLALIDTDQPIESQLGELGL